MRVVSKRQRRHRRLEHLRRASSFALTRIVPLSLVVLVLAQLWSPLRRWLETSPHVQLERVMVSGNRFLTAREVVSIAGIEPGAALASLRPEEAEGRLRLHPRVRRASVRYVFPRAVRLVVEERRPIALVEHGGPRAVSSDGVLLPPVEGRELEDLPLVLPPAGLRVDGHLVQEPALLDALAFLVELERVDARLGSVVSLVDVTDVRFARVYLDTLSTALVYEIGGHWTEHVRALPAVIEDLARARAEGVVLDLRFREQIVRRGGTLAQLIPASARD